MKEQLEVKNFGPLKEFNIDLKPIMVFIGVQATGKSTIAKLIAIFRAKNFILEYVSFKDMLAHHNIASFLSNDSYINFTSESYSFYFKNGQGRIEEVKDHEFNIKKKSYREHREKIQDTPYGDLNIINRESLKKEIDGKEQERAFLLNETIKDESKINNLSKEIDILGKKLKLIEADWKKWSEFSDEIRNLENYSEYFPAERIFIPTAVGSFMNLIKNKVPIPKNLLDFGAEYEKARAFLKELDLQKILSVNYKFEDGQDRIYFDLDKYIPLNASASGFQTLIPMLMVIEYKTKLAFKEASTFIVEEPELNLFPSAQKYLTRVLIEKCASVNKDKTKEHELVITTHSPYILSSFNNQLFAGKISLKKATQINLINSIIPKECWIDSNRFAAYSVENGGTRSIVDSENGLISETELDSASEEINGEFDALMEIYKAK
jgi:predicted ATPase